jgi:hypothetical protein
MDMRCPPNTLGIFSKCLMNIWKDYVSSQKNPSKKELTILNEIGFPTILNLP